MPTVLAMPSQGSGVLSSMSEADCLIVLGHNQESIEPGELVDIVLFEGLI
jgi:molybdopterin molybdotransferase